MSTRNPVTDIGNDSGLCDVKKFGWKFSICCLIKALISCALIAKIHTTFYFKFYNLYFSGIQRFDDWLSQQSRT